MSDPDLTPISADESPESGAAGPVASKIVVPAIEPVVWPKKKSDGTKFKLQLPPPLVWEYRLGDGSLHGVVARWDRDGDKIVLPAVCVERDGRVEWAWQGFGEGEGSRPLLGLMELAAKPLATVLVVEGEKTRDAAARYLPETWVCVTWQGGGKAVNKTDWSPLQGRRVVLWMDKDAPPVDGKTGTVRLDPKTKKPMLPPGEATGLQLFSMLSDLGAGVAMVPVYGPNMSMIPNNGWDLADPLPEGLNPTDWMTRAAAFINVPTAKVEPSRTEVNGKPQLVVDNSDRPPPDKRGGSGTNERAEYKAVGYSKEDGKPVFHFFVGQFGFIITLTGKELSSRNGIWNIVNNDNYWRERYGWSRQDFEKVPYALAAQRLMDECKEAGYFEVEKERGRGAWLDDTGPDGKSRVVMHLGQTLVVDGKVINPSKLESEYYYPIKHKLITLKQVPPLTDAEGRLIRQLARLISWKRSISAEMFGGWLATAPVCGAMPWRTHLWMTGPSSAGKSWITDNIVKPALGDIAFKPIGASSAAGIMASLERDARPVVFDESEAKGPEGERRRQMVIELMRYSSTQSDGEIVKGTATHGKVGFSAKIQWYLASIGVGIVEQADRTRTYIAEIIKRPVDSPEFEQMKQLVKKLPKDMPERLLRRQLAQLRTIRENADTFASVISLQLGSRRLGDMLGTLMAGDHSLVSDKPIDFDEAERRVSDRMTKKQFVDFLKVSEDAEDVDLLRHLVSWSVPAQGKGNVRYDRPIGELLHIAMGKYQDDHVSQFEADDALRRIGIQREKREGVPGFWLARTKSYVATRVMAGSTYSQGWDRILAAMPGCVESDKDRSFAGAKLPALWIPFETLVMGIDETQGTQGGSENSPQEPDPSLV